MRSQKSFTLIELLIVIGILAILVAVVVVVLNPAQLFAQARDSKRQQDLSALNQALNTVYALDQTVSFGTASTVYTSLPDSSSTCGSWGLPSLPSGWSYHCSPTSTLQNTNGSGWIPVNFQSNGVVNLSALPTDPVNASSTGLYYTYVTGGSFQLAAQFESSKYQATEGSDAMYTVGSNLSLAPFLSGLVGYWPLNEGTGTIAYDLSGYNNNGTWYGTSTPHYATSNGKTVGYFNGVSDYVQINGTATSAFNLYPGVRTIVFRANRFNNRFTVFLDYNGTGAMALAFWQLFDPMATNDQRCIPPDIDSYINNWMQYAFIQNRAPNVGYAIGYVNVVSKCNYQGLDYSGPINQTGITIGGPNYDGYLNGYVSDVRIYNRALSASEISALYNATK